MLSIYNKTFLIRQDTALLIPSGIKYKVSDNKSDRFYMLIDKKMHHNKLLRELHSLVVAPADRQGKNDTARKPYNSIMPYVIYNGLPIRTIKIRQLDVFGPTITDTSKMAETWVEQTGNRLHIQSKRYLIENSLLFKKGDRLNAPLMADNERILRSLPYLEDARILVSKDMANDSVDVLVLTKDNWPNAFDLELNNAHSGRLVFWNNNLLGYGHQVQNSILWNTQLTPMSGYQGNYGLTNLSGTFINANLSYLNAFGNEVARINAIRSFIIPNIKYGGGISITHSRNFEPLRIDTLKKNYVTRGNHYDVWLGRSFLVNHKDDLTKFRKNITFTARFMQDKIYQKPTLPDNIYYNLQSKTLFLGSVSYTNQSYFKSNLIYNFGRTEDIPLGGIVQFNFGFENNEYFKRNYAGLSIGRSLFFERFGYFYGSVSAGSFFGHHSHYQQGMITSHLDYFSKLISIQKFKFRQFVNFGFTRGIQRFQDEYLTINNTNGIHGFSNDSVRGSNRFNMHWETDCFTPYYFYNFRMVFFISADHSWLTDNLRDLFRQIPYTGIGLGVRIRNERLVFNTIEIRVSFFPHIPSGSTTHIFNVAGEPLLSPPTFIPEPAGIINYQ